LYAATGEIHTSSASFKPACERRRVDRATAIRVSLIKSQLLQLGDEMNYHMCASAVARSDDGRPPWGDCLYDLTWLQMVNDGKEVARVPLVFESECHSGCEEQIDANFQELLLARADPRVMVFQQRKAAAVQEVMDMRERQAKACRATGPGGMYLLCGYDWEDTRRFALRTVAT
jgi:hypothetical protein